MGIPTSRDHNTPEGLESQLSVRIHRILAELPKLDQTRAQKTPLNPNGFQQSFCARATPRTPNKLGSLPALITSPLTLYSTKIEFGSPLGG
jgi:hypothetical protein